MKRRRIGRSDLEVSVVGLGCNNFGGRIDLDASKLVIDAAIDAGINFLDTADIYGNAGGSEEIIGQVLGERRKDVVLASKFGMQMGDDATRKGASRKYIFAAAEASLKRLRTDWIDLYQLHTPDAETPIEETARALDDLVKQGKVRCIGVSNMPAWQVVDSLWITASAGMAGFVSCQDEYSLLAREPEKELIPMIEAKGLGLLPYFPLASGLLTGKYLSGQMPAGTRIANTQRLRDRVMTDRNIQLVESLNRFAGDRGHSLLELAFSWLLARPGVPSVIAGATKPEQVEANAKAANWDISADDLAEVSRILDSSQ